MTPCMNSRFASPSSPSDVNDTHDKVRICTELIGQPKILNAIFHLLSLGKRKCSVDKSEEHQSADRSMIVVSWGWGCDLCNKRVLSGISLPSSFSSACTLSKAFGSFDTCLLSVFVASTMKVVSNPSQASVVNQHTRSTICVLLFNFILHAVLRLLRLSLVGESCLHFLTLTGIRDHFF